MKCNKKILMVAMLSILTIASVSCGRRGDSSGIDSSNSSFSSSESSSSEVSKSSVSSSTSSSTSNSISSSSNSSSSSSNSSTPKEDVYLVQFDSKGGSKVDAQNVKKGELVSRPTDPTKEGMHFEGWYTSSTYEEKYNFNTQVTSDFTLYAKWVEKQDEGKGEIVSQGSVKIISASGSNESAYILFNKYNDITEYEYYINGTKLTDKEVYTHIEDGVYRADFFGLKKGDYQISVLPKTDNVTSSIVQVGVTCFDRSGYAHFNYSSGIGAYKDDGTLKENAIVLYVTDENKNSVELAYKGISVKGIGNILNSVGQECNESGHEGQCKKVSDGKTYYGKANTNKGILKILADDNIPLVIRVIGTISESGLYKPSTYSAADSGLIDGLTDYDCVDYGGSVGDNGHMARIKAGKDITIEGVGDNATFDGWGVHFMADSASINNGKSFEVRNITFMNTPEDALGMEGIQSGTKITAPVERVWVHHNSFLAPDISSPAESDKAQGDGSCDFKRGQYFTMSYNYFEYCHKTNLIGSSDSSLQYNISMHHNYWYNCGSRIPLLRQANVHFYNNYIYGDSNDSEASLSYVHSLRANCYLYSENNFYEGCKNPVTDGSSTTGCKMYGNTMVECFGDQIGTIVSSREEKVSSSCAYDGTSYANFDTNTKLFYYDDTTKQSDCYLTSAADARSEVIKLAGSNYRTVLNKTKAKTITTTFNTITPTNAVDVPTSGVKNVTLPTSKGQQTLDNIDYSNITGVSSGVVKFRGESITFKLDKYASFTIAGTGSSTQALAPISILKSDNTLIGSNYGTFILSPGIYVVTSCQKDKDSTITSMSFENYNAEGYKEELINKYNEAYNAIGEVEFNDDKYELILKAIEAYEALGEYKSEVTTSPYTKKNEYILLNIAYVEKLINEIGDVDENSSSVISKARDAYNELLSKDENAVISNLNTLVEAEDAYKNYAINGCIKLIDAIGEVTLDSKTKIEDAEKAYALLDDSQKASVTNYNVLVTARETYNSLVSLNDIKTLIEQVNLDNTTLDELNNVLTAYSNLSSDNKTQIDLTYASKLSQIRVLYTSKLISEIPSTIDLSSYEAISKARTMYDSLSEEEKASVTNYSVLTNAETEYNNIASQTHSITFENGATDESGFFTFTNCNTKTEKVTANGKNYTVTLKIESKTEISATLSKESTVTIIASSSYAGKSIKINGTKYTFGADGTLVVNVSKGSLTITKGDSMNICEIIVS